MIFQLSPSQMRSVSRSLPYSSSRLFCLSAFSRTISSLLSVRSSLLLGLFFFDVSRLPHYRHDRAALLLRRISSHLVTSFFSLSAFCTSFSFLRASRFLSFSSIRLLALFQRVRLSYLCKTTPPHPLFPYETSLRRFSVIFYLPEARVDTLATKVTRQVCEDDLEGYSVCRRHSSSFSSSSLRSLFSFYHKYQSFSSVYNFEIFAPWEIFMRRDVKSGI